MLACDEQALPGFEVDDSNGDKDQGASGEKFCPVAVQHAIRAGRLCQFCAKDWRANSNAILVRTLTAEIFLRTFVLYPWRLNRVSNAARLTQVFFRSGEEL